MSQAQQICSFNVGMTSCHVKSLVILRTDIDIVLVMAAVIIVVADLLTGQCRHPPRPYHIIMATGSVCLRVLRQELDFKRSC